MDLFLQFLGDREPLAKRQKLTQSHPHQRRPRPSYSSSRRSSDVPTPNLLLNKSEPSNSLAFSESFAAYFPKKCVKNEPTEPTEPNPFDQLSDELVVKIFSYFSHAVLTKVFLVSKRFRRIGKLLRSIAKERDSIMNSRNLFLACDESLWKRMNLGGKGVSPGTRK